MWTDSEAEPAQEPAADRQCCLPATRIAKTSDRSPFSHQQLPSSPSQSMTQFIKVSCKHIRWASQLYGHKQIFLEQEITGKSSWQYCAHHSFKGSP